MCVCVCVCVCGVGGSECRGCFSPYYYNVDSTRLRYAMYASVNHGGGLEPRLAFNLLNLFLHTESWLVTTCDEWA